MSNIDKIKKYSTVNSESGGQTRDSKISEQPPFTTTSIHHVWPIIQAKPKSTRTSSQCEIRITAAYSSTEFDDGTEWAEREIEISPLGLHLFIHCSGRSSEMYWCLRPHHTVGMGRREERHGYSV